MNMRLKVLTKPCLILIIILLLSGVGLIHAETTHLSDLPAALHYTASAAMGCGLSVYHAEAELNGFRAVTPAQNYTTHLNAQGITLTTGQAKLMMRLTGVGYGESLTAVEPALPISHDNRIEYRRDGLTEWYVNGPLGLQQGFTLAERPEADFPMPTGVADEPLTLELTLSANWQAIISIDGHSLNLTADGASLRYSGLTAIDDAGAEQPASLTFDPISHAVKILIDDSAALYPLTIDPFFQQAYLKASNVEADDRFGYSVAIDGDYAVIGAPYEDGNGSSGSDNSATWAGAAYVFARSGASWSQQAYLKASNAEAGDRFGNWVAISGDYAVVGALGEAGDGSSEGDNSADGAGAAYVFVRSGTSWSQQAYLKASNAEDYDYFGKSVAISGDYVVVGAPDEDGNGSSPSDNSALWAGAAYVFVRSGVVWSQQAYLKASNAGNGDDLGRSVAISGDYVVVGAIGEDGNGSGESDNSAYAAGAAYVFARSGTSWSQQAYLKASNAEAEDSFGSSVAISGDYMVVGAYGEDGNGSSESDNSATWAGAAYVFRRSGTSWSQQAYLKASNAEEGDSFGRSAAISGDYAVVGAAGEAGNGSSESDNSAPGAGAAYVFMRSGTSWSRQTYLKAANIEAFDYFGDCVAISGIDAVIGAPFEDGNGSGESDNSASGAGAAYVYSAGSVAGWPFVFQRYSDKDKQGTVPAIGEDGTIYTLGGGGPLSAISPAGGLKWQFMPTVSGISSSASIAPDGTIYAGRFKKLYAINPNGTIKWTRSTNGGIVTCPAIGADGTIYIGCEDCMLYALKPDSTNKWNPFPTEAPISSSPAIDADGNVWVGSEDNKIYKISGANGSKLWEYSTQGAIAASPAIGTDGTVYFASHDGFLYAVKNNSLQWKVPTGAYIDSSPVIGPNGTIYIGSSTGALYALTPKGSQKWSFRTGGVIESDPAVDSEGVVYISSTDGYLYAVLSNGNELWRKTGDGGNGLFSSPTISDDGNLYVLWTIGENQSTLYRFASGRGVALSSWPKLSQNIKNTGRIIGNLPAPIVSSIAPDSAPNTGSVNISDLEGTNFQTDCTVKLTKSGQADIIASNVAILNPSQITCTLNLSGKAPGSWNLVVGNPDGQSSGSSGNSMFTITGVQSSIAVTNPDGGEVWDVGTAQSITWISSGNSGNIKIEYTTNGGSSWTTIISNTADDGRHSWTIPNTPSTNCRIRVSDTDGSPSDMSDGVFTIRYQTSVLDDLNSSSLPGHFELHSNNPNPFNPSTQISYDLPERSWVRLQIYDVLGRKVEEVVYSGLEAGVHQFEWRPKGDSGIYFCHLEATALQGENKTYRSTIKMTFAK